MPKDFSYIDLFSGIGGFRLALDSLEGNCLGFSEIHKDAISVYCENFNEPVDHNFGDITKIKKLPKCNLLTAGVPCQSWSIAGRNLGFDDDRGQLWNDTIYLLNQSKPDAFIFENVKGLVDPRNQLALDYILIRIKEAGYHAKYFVLNSFDYGVPQNRLRIYIIGFKHKNYLEKFEIKSPLQIKVKLGDILNDYKPSKTNKIDDNIALDLFGNPIVNKKFSLSSSNGLNDYFLFNDIRNGHSTIHSWDIINTTDRQKEICYILLKNRRKKAYGVLDGNPLSLKNFKQLDSSITKKELEELVILQILKKEEYAYEVLDFKEEDLDQNEKILLDNIDESIIKIDELKVKRVFKVNRISITSTISSLVSKGMLKCVEERYDFKNTKISTGLFGVNRIFLPNSNIFPTLVASDTNDFVSTIEIKGENSEQFKKDFIDKIYNKKKYRRVTKEEACLIQGFPQNFQLPATRARWMKLIGNSVSVPVIKMLGERIKATGVFEK
jgi:DNA (cytosine-5)-methyltransferase 1